MKNIALSIAIIVLLAACSSGSTVADTPFNVTGIYSGEFENSRGTEDGSFILNIAESATGEITGNIIFDADENSSTDCATNAVVSGSTSGFTVILEVAVEEGVVNYQLTQSNSGNTLSGTYVGVGIESCSNASGSGTVVINR